MVKFRHHKKRPKANSGWYCFSINNTKMFCTTKGIDYREDQEISQYGVKPYCTKYVNGVFID